MLVAKSQEVKTNQGREVWELGIAALVGEDNCQCKCGNTLGRFANSVSETQQKMQAAWVRAQSCPLQAEFLLCPVIESH